MQAASWISYWTTVQDSRPGTREKKKRQSSLIINFKLLPHGAFENIMAFSTRFEKVIYKEKLKEKKPNRLGNDKSVLYLHNTKMKTWRNRNKDPPSNGYKVVRHMTLPKQGDTNIWKETRIYDQMTCFSHHL